MCMLLSFVCSSLPPYNLHLNLHVDQCRDVYDHHCSYPLGACSYCQSFGHDVNFYFYYDLFYESYARLNAMIEKMNEQHTPFVSEMREGGSLHETDPSLPFS